MSVVPRVVVAWCCFVTITILGGCSAVDAVDQRTTVMNESIADAGNKGILLNLARASLAEPLSFSTLSNFTGHNSIGGGLAYPTFGAAGNQLRIQSASVTGPTTTGSITNDFVYTGNDDKETYSALLQPVSLALLGKFVRQDYNRELLFYLLVNRIRVVRGTTTVADYPNTAITAYDLDHYPAHKRPFELFGKHLQELVQAGLTVQVDTSAQDARLCFERTGRPYYDDTVTVRTVSFGPACGDDAVVRAKVGPKNTAFQTGFRVHDRSDGTDWEISLRSAFGLYRYLGTNIREQIPLGLLADPHEADHVLVTVTQDGGDCFVEEEYRGRHFCVPNSAYTTKRVFSLLHDLVKLSTPQAAAPTPTISARVIGQ